MDHNYKLTDYKTRHGVPLNPSTLPVETEVILPKDTYHIDFDCNRGIYAIECKELMRAYVGQSKNVPTRLRGHKSSLRKGKYKNGNGKMRHLQADWDRLGESVFKFKQLCECTEDLDLYTYETLHCQDYHDRGYSLYNTHINTDTGMVTCPEKFVPVIKQVIDLLDKGVLTQDKLQENIDYLESGF